MADDLEAARRLYEKKAITKEEYETMRKQILNQEQPMQDSFNGGRRYLPPRFFMACTRV